MDNTAATVDGIMSAAKGILAGGCGVTLATIVYRVFFKILDNRDKHTGRVMGQEDSTRKQLGERVKDLEQQLIPLAQAASQVAWYQTRNKELEEAHTRLENDNDKLKRECLEWEFKWRQEATKASGLTAITDILNSPQGQEFLKQYSKHPGLSEASTKTLSKEDSDIILGYITTDDPELRQEQS